MAEQDYSNINFSLNGNSQKLIGQTVETDLKNNTNIMIGFQDKDSGSTQYIEFKIIDFTAILVKAIKDSTINSEIIEQATETIINLENITKLIPVKITAAIQAFKNTDKVE